MLDKAVGVARRMDGLPVTHTHLRVVLAVGLGLFFDMYEVFLAGTVGTALTSTFGLSGTGLALVLASAFLGMFVGAAFVARLADRFGRRRLFLFSLLWYSVFSLLGAFSPNAATIVVCRFLAGIGVGAEYPVSDTYLSDVLPSGSRGRLAAWAYTCSYLAVPALGFLSLGTSWRWLLAIGAAGAIGVLILRRNLPESPRWLESVGRHAEAEAAYEQFAQAKPLRRQPSPSPFTAEEPEPQPTKTLTTAALTKPPYRRRMVMLGVFHLLQTFGYYGFGTLAVLVLAARGFTVQHSLLYTALSFLGYPIGSLLSIPLIHRLERKFLVIGTVIAMAVVGVVFASAAAPAVIVVAGFAFTAISNVFSNAYHIYQAEILPTELRASGTGWTYSVSRLATGAMPFVLLPLLSTSGPVTVFTVVAAAMVLVAVDIAVLGPRTSGRSVEAINPR
ncbi:MFS transporter [Kutzneria sp. CA-103260]|uniref:MFS transporter n=1 Tax=Kutzneria sp. CA-103260 TaxID=2802641 RepID=UPI001BA4D62E|nr:MFS transporter [Kutzneria sp. CA-103260]QUQ64719.1 MFS transporter metabolite:H+ symporter [Kutzneria sp. CA-103260]